MRPRSILKDAKPFPRAALGAATAALGVMTYSLVRFGRKDNGDVSKTVAKQPPAQQANAVKAGQAGSSHSFLSVGEAPRSAANVPSYVLATSGLDNEQKLQVALCRRQAWLRAFQLGPTLALWTYAGCVLLEASKWTKLPRGTKMAAPLVAAVVGATFGSYYGGLEGKPMMNAALTARPVEHAHKRRADRPPEEDALVAFVREGTKKREPVQ